MKASELRIGNLLHYYNPLFQEPQELKVLGIYAEDSTHFIESSAYAPINIKGLKPIPITEEWLLKFGFEEVYKSPMHATYYIDNLSYYFWYKKGNQYADCKGLQVEICYVHQLQNLYFALTNTELC